MELKGKTESIYLVNDKKEPVRYGMVNIEAEPSRASSEHKMRDPVMATTVITGFCGTDYELMEMGMKKKLSEKFPPYQKRLIPGHEGVVYIPDFDRYGIVYLRRTTDRDPTRYGDGHSMTEYGCHQADGIMSKIGYFNPDVVAMVPEDIIPKGGKITLEQAKKLVLAEPYACLLFLKERVEDIIEGHNFRLFLNKRRTLDSARKMARDRVYDRVVIFGCGTIGAVAAFLISNYIKEMKLDSKIVAVDIANEKSKKVQFIKKNTIAAYIKNENIKDLPKKIIDVLKGHATLFIGASGTTIESEIAFNANVLGNNGIYSSFSLGPDITINTMPFGFKNQVIYGAIYCRQDHMEKAIKSVVKFPFDELVTLYPFEELKRSPFKFYKRIFEKEKDVVKAAVIWEKSLISI